MSRTDQRLETLIKSNEEVKEEQRQTNANMLEISSSMATLATIEAGRAVREEHQGQVNEKFDKFITDNNNTLVRIRAWLKRWDGAWDKILVLLIIAVLTAAGFNWLQ